MLVTLFASILLATAQAWKSRGGWLGLGCNVPWLSKCGPNGRNTLFTIGCECLPGWQGSCCDQPVPTPEPYRPPVHHYRQETTQTQTTVGTGGIGGDNLGTSVTIGDGTEVSWGAVNYNYEITKGREASCDELVHECLGRCVRVVDSSMMTLQACFSGCAEVIDGNVADTSKYCHHRRENDHFAECYSDCASKFYDSDRSLADSCEKGCTFWLSS